MQVLRGWNVEDVRVSPDSGGAVVEAVPWRDAHAPGSSLTVEADYVVGCDGANSLVRDRIGTPVEDLGFAFDWLIVDIRPHEPMDFDPPAVQWCNPAQPTTIVPGGPGRRRWEFMRMPEETIEELNTTENAWRRLAPWGVTPQDSELERHAVYTFRASWADEWRRGPLLIAGDAAHLMPPFAGQGMCSGLRDAANLAWRLDAILTGRSDDKLLDPYGPERRDHVQHFIQMSMSLGQTICVTDPAAAAARDEAMFAAVEDPSLAPVPPPTPSLGPGTLGNHPAAGLLTPQGTVTTREGRRGLFDDVVGRGWILLCTTSPDDLNNESGDEPSATDGMRVVVLGEDIEDDALYRDWLAELGAEFAIVRPDFYLYDAGSMTDLDSTLNALQQQL